MFTVEIELRPYWFIESWISYFVFTELIQSTDLWRVGCNKIIMFTFEIELRPYGYRVGCSKIIVFTTEVELKQLIEICVYTLQ